MKAFAAALFIAATSATELEWRGGYGNNRGYGGYGGYNRSAGTHSHTKLVKVPGYTEKTVYDNVKTLVPEKRVRNTYAYVDDIVYKNVSKTVIENVPRTVIDEIVKVVVDTVPTKVIDQVKERSYRKDIIVESNDSGDGIDSGSTSIYVPSVSSNDSECDTWANCTSSDDSGYCDTWNKNCVSSNDSISSYVITSDSSDDARVVITPVTTTRDVERTVYKKVPREVRTQRERTVIDRVPKTITKRVGQKVTRKVPKQVVDTVLREVNTKVPRTVKVPTTRLESRTTTHNHGGYNRGYGGYNRGYGGYGGRKW